MLAASRIRKWTLVLSIVTLVLDTDTFRPTISAMKEKPAAACLPSVTDELDQRAEDSKPNTSPGAISKQAGTYAEQKSAAETDRRRSRKGHKRSKQAQHAVSWAQLQKMYPSAFYLGGPRKVRKVALTFDDVPDVKYTPQVLDVLAKYKVRATFFVVGSRARAHPSVVRRMRREGHLIGNHSYNHPVFTQISMQKFQQQVLRTDAVLRPLAGYSPKLIRPPYGEILPKQIEWAKRNGFVIVNWNVDSEDWKSLDSSSIIINIKRTLKPGSIILQHAGGGGGQDLSGTINALPRLIRLLRSKGYQIVTLPELLNRPVARSS
ncbi:polysaccharide deacetylase family protein [Paenibacillus spongiae]|uniref:Polysaccharide deacetylase family protein n=1 Tax=Paenibacillus spongiae TaxID=2909671 RepID=A0ABY5SCL0_9BACL|nr:polysaccharide deacetylase family protein [Paenibacillus spongiae]UVI31691.1 polysaccharide deacetylase family protein [Paenibacillus spongiae]